MSCDLAAFYSSLENVRTDLQVFAKRQGSIHTLNSALFQKFLYHSITYVSTQSASNGKAEDNQVLLLADWFSDLSQAIRLLFQHHSDWDSKCLSPKNLISYLSNISYKLLSVQEVPLEWHRLIWVAVLHAMALCCQLPSPEPEFISSVAQMGYKILRSAGQSAEWKHKLDKSLNVDQCYELYILGAAIVSQDTTGKSGDSLKLAKDFLSAYHMRSYKSRPQKASQADVLSAECEQPSCRTRMLNMAVTVYTSQPRDVAADASLAFYVELFRLVLEDSLFCEKLLACAGDLFKYVPIEDTDDFPAAVTRAVRQSCSTASTADEKSNTSSVRGIVLAVLTFVHEMRRVCRVHKEDLGLENGSKSGLTEDIHFAMDGICDMLKESPGPVTAAVSGSLLVYTHSMPKAAEHASPELLATCIRMNSLSMDVFVRDIFSCAFKQSQAELVCQRLHTLGLVTTTNILLLETHLTRNELGDERVREVADMLKSTLASLHRLAEAASKKRDMYPDLYKNSLTILRRAMSDVGTVGRKLTRLGLYSVTITLLAPLWPVTRIEELLPTVSHHGALCESYWKTSQLKEAWSVISRAVIIDASLVSESLISIIVKILKQETSLSVLKLLEPCQDRTKQVQLLVCVVRKLAWSQSLPALRHAIIILRCLVQHDALSDVQRAPHHLLLAQTLWLEAEDKVSVSGECLQLLVKTVKSLQADTSHQFDDVLVQAAFLYWGVLSAASHQDTSEQSVQVDTEFLMMKASACLIVWTKWFSSVGNKLLDTDGTFRLETSLRFLQRVAELAVISYKTMTAVTALCRAHHLASLMKRPDVVEDILQALVSLIPSLGLGVEELKLGQSGDLMGVIAAAGYHLRTRQMDKYVSVRSVAGGIIDNLRKQGLRTPSIYTGQAILNRLDAEFHSLPSSNRPTVAVEPTPYPLELVGESLKYIKNVVTFHLGEDPQNSISKSPPLEVWPVIHEYLTSLRLYGDLCLHVGSAKYAKTYFTEGLLMADKFLLVVWSALFSACLLKVALVSQDTTAEAEDLLQNTVGLLKRHRLAVDSLSDKNLTDAVTCQQLYRLVDPKGAAAMPESPCSYCPVLGCGHAHSVRERLLDKNSEPLEQVKAEIGDSDPEWKPLEQDETGDSEWKPLSPAGTCYRCFQPELADLCAGLMCSQAEILWRQKKPVRAVTSSLQAALDSSQCLTQMSPKQCVENIFSESGLNLGLLLKGNNLYSSRMLSTVYQLAEVTFQSLYFNHHREPASSGHDEAAILETQNLLDIVEREGKKMKACATSNVAVASALLLKSHFSYLPLLHTVEEVEEDVDSDRAAIVQALEATNKQKQCWGQQICSLLSSPQMDSSKTKSCSAQQTKGFQKSKMSSLVTSPAGGDREDAADCSGQDENKTNIAASSQRARSNSSDHTNSSKQARVMLSEMSLQQSASNTEDNIGAESSCAGDSYSKRKHSRVARNGKTRLRKPPEHNLNCDNSTSVSTCSHSLGTVGQPSELADHVSGRCAGYCVATPQRSPPGVGSESQTHGNSLRSPLMILHQNREHLNEQKKQRFQKCESSYRSVGQAAVGCRDGGRKEVSPEMTEISVAAQESNHDMGSNASLGAVTDVIEVKEWGKTTQAVRRGRVRQHLSPETCSKARRKGQTSPETCTKSRKIVIKGQITAETCTKVSQKEQITSETCTKVRRKGQITSETCTKARRKGKITPEMCTKARRIGRKVEDAETERAADGSLDLSYASSDSMFLEQISAGSFRDFWGCCRDEDAAGGCCRDEDAAGECVPGVLPRLGHCVSDVDMPHLSDVGHHGVLPRRVGHCDSDVDMSHHSHVGHLKADQIRTDPLTPEKLPLFWDPCLLSSAEIPRGRTQRKKTDIKETSEPEVKRAVRGRPRRTAVNGLQVDVTGSKLRLHLDNGDKENLTPIVEKDNGLQSTPASGRAAGRLQELFSPNIANMPEILAVTARRRAPRKRVVLALGGGGGGMDLSQSGEPKSQVKLGVTTTSREERAAMDDVDLQAMTTKFPTLNFCQPVTARRKYLQDALQQLDQFAPSVLHRQVSQSLALCLWEEHMTGGKHGGHASSSQLEIAAYLTDSMHATFQHQMAKNLRYKLRKAQDKPASDNNTNHSCPSREDATKDTEAMRTALTSLSFGGDVNKRFTDRMASLPADWTVSHVTVVDLDSSNPGQGQLFVTRLTSGLEPLTVGLPYNRWPALQRSLRLYEMAIEHKTDHADLKQHWTHRHEQDNDMQNLVHYLQDLFLGAHKWLLRGQVACVKELAVQALMNQAAQDTVDSVLQLHGYHVSHGSVRNLLEVLLEAPEKDVSSLLGCVWPAAVSHTVSRAVIRVQKAVLGLCEKSCGERRGPVVLILDKTLNKIPWESMPDLSLDTVTRVPSLASLHVMLTLHNKRASSPFVSGVVRNSAVAVIPPDTDLQNAVSHLAPQFQQYPGWKCLVQKAPTVSELKCFLADSSLYLYCGHSWGHQYVGGRDVQLFNSKAVAILMGCGSGRLEQKRKLDGDGGPLYFLLAGCPTVVGNLWLVTDKDIDKLTSCLFSHWMAQTEPVSLGQLLSVARKVCKLGGLTGFAPVVYGLPVMMN